MKKTIATIIACISIMGCSSDNVKEIKTTTTAEAAAIAPFVDENKIATIISNSGEILSKTDLKKDEPIVTTDWNLWSTVIPYKNNDTLNAETVFIDGVIYYSYRTKK